jgi:hypothetical protein
MHGGKSSYAFIPLPFAQGALLAGQIASIVAILAPLLLFTPKLARAKREGLAEYGTFASSDVMDFDQKWLRSKVNEGELLGTGDIQSLADLGNIFAVVREMRAVPFATDDVLRLLIATVVPIVPLLLTIIPLEQLVTQAIKIIF